MAQKLYEESNIQAIADAIRGKNGLTNTYKTSEMAAAISAIQTGGGVPEELYKYTGDLSHKFAYGRWDWVISKYKNIIITSDVTSMDFMFFKSNVEEIPFEINCKKNEIIRISHMFQDAQRLKTLPKINNCKIQSMDGFLDNCCRLREIPDDYIDQFDWSYFISQTSQYRGGGSNYLISYCHSLRKFPLRLFQKVCSAEHGDRVGYRFYGSGHCYTMDEVENIPVITNKTFTSNLFWFFLSSFSRVKSVTFETNDGIPKIVQWKSSTLDLSDYVGYARYTGDILGYNSGITADKEVKDDATYQALKDDPDWFTIKVEYSRYNHDSAVATINSLPDTSAYLASAGGTNTIKFKGAAGSATDGGAINTLTEEEIAVATAKAWTVSLV